MHLCHGACSVGTVPACASGLVFQSYNLVPSMSVEDNLKLPFILRKIRWPEDQALKLLVGLGIRGRAAACGPGPCADFGSQYYFRR